MTLTRRVTPPALIPTLVRAMAAVAGTPPKNGSDDVSDTLGDELLIDRQFAAGHAAADDAAQQAFDRAEHADGEGGHCQRRDQVEIDFDSERGGPRARFRAGMAPIVAASQSNPQAMAVAMLMPMSAAGMARTFLIRGRASITAITMTPHADGVPVDWRQRLAEIAGEFHDRSLFRWRSGCRGSCRSAQ